jgi:hypothetical protein
MNRENAMIVAKDDVLAAWSVLESLADALMEI